MSHHIILCYKKERQVFKIVFSSLLFLFIFFPIVLALYFITPKKFRNLVLFLSSLVFYAWGEPVYVVIMLFSTVVDYTHGMLVDRFKKAGDDKKAKLAVASSMIINLALLGFFKYSDFIIANINAVFGTSIGLLNLPLPIGISFYTFQTMSYTIDIYRGDAKVQKNIISFGAYVALFPQLIAGPIVRYQTIADQLDKRHENFDKFSYGITRFIMGLGKKVLLANNIGYLWSQISASPVSEISVLGAWLGIIAFTFQIYFDFSGYSDMAIGLGSMFGFKFLENFNYPYTSTSITDFWRRWHISLGTWFKEYVYIPLGGNRHGFAKQIRNIFIVWLLTGIWHGASWNFIVWGLYFGILLMVEKLFLLKYLEKLPRVFGHIYTMLLVIISWVIFAFDSLSQGIDYIKAMFGGYGAPFVDMNTMYLGYTNAVLILILIVACTDYPKKLYLKLKGFIDKHDVVAAVIENIVMITIMLLSVAYLVDASYNPFLYFRF